MASRLCPFCLRMSETETCHHCGKNINYAGSAGHLPAGYVVSGRRPYVLGAALGQGGFGITYIALDMVTNTRVAIKEYYPTYCSTRADGTTVAAYPKQEEFYRKGKERFLEEARTMKSLSDLKNIVDVLDFFEANNTAYLVMEFLEGSSLKDYAIKNGRFPANKFLGQICPLMEDIHRMHERGVIHRDIAPDNIILLPDGQMKLIDFGAARSYLGDQSMTVVVKKGFVPVEQYLSSGSGPSTDVYALAATIYYCLTGTVPPDSAQRQSMGTPLVSPTALGTGITHQQETALLKALEVQQQARTQSVQEFLDQLQSMPFPEENKKTPRKEPQKPVKADSEDHGDISPNTTYTHGQPVMSLLEYVRKYGKFPAQHFLSQIRTVATEIKWTHQKGLVHNNISPDNIYLLPDGRMKLTGFEQACPSGTRNAVFFNDWFAPLESYLSHEPVTSGTDVYSFAATVYFCITGKYIPRATDRKLFNEPLQLPSVLGSDITPTQEAALLKALELNQSERTQSIEEFLDDLAEKAPPQQVYCLDHNSPLPEGYILRDGSSTYKLDGVFSRDGSTVIYSAHNTVTGASLSIKELFLSERSERCRDGKLKPFPYREEKYIQSKELFLNDARTLQKLNFLNHIVRVLDYFEANNTAYMVMEPLDGITLREHVKKYGKFPVPVFIQRILPLINDLQQFHDRGIIHPRISPDYILIQTNGQLKIEGLTEHYDLDWLQKYDGPLAFDFRPLEELTKKYGPVTASANVYSLAATIYYCCTGQKLQNAPDRLFSDIPLVLPSSLSTSITPEQERALRKALAVLPGERYKNVQVFLRDFNSSRSSCLRPPVLLPDSPQKTTETHQTPTAQSTWLCPECSMSNTGSKCILCGCEKSAALQPEKTSASSHAYRERMEYPKLPVPAAMFFSIPVIILVIFLYFFL